MEVKIIIVSQSVNITEGRRIGEQYTKETEKVFIQIILNMLCQLPIKAKN